MMTRTLVHIFTVLVLVLGFQVEVGGARDEDDATSQMHRLFYLFSLQVPEQCERACVLQKQVRAYSHQLQVIGVVRGAKSAEGNSHSLEEFRRRHSLSYHLVTAAAALTQDDLEMPTAVKERLAATGDFVLLLDQDGHQAGSGAGEELYRLLGRFAPVSTDVDESTWGKIKELFQ